MVSDIDTTPTLPITEAVLILVLMEYGLWHDFVTCEVHLHGVLILVLMEYGLWHEEIYRERDLGRVLILVLMEYGLWH